MSESQKMVYKPSLDFLDIKQSGTEQFFISIILKKRRRLEPNPHFVSYYDQTRATYGSATLQINDMKQVT